MNDMSTPTDLPVWDLDDLYKGTSDPAIEADLTWLETEAGRFRETWAGRIATLSGDELAEASMNLASWKRILKHPLEAKGILRRNKIKPFGF